MGEFTEKEMERIKLILKERRNRVNKELIDESYSETVTTKLLRTELQEIESILKKLI